MTTALCGETQGRPPAADGRVEMLVHPETRERLRELLYQPFMRGVGWSEFINRAIDRAYEEADEQGLFDGRGSA